MSEELVCHFGKNVKSAMSDIMCCYLRWAAKTIDTNPLPPNQKHEEGKQK